MSEIPDGLAEAVVVRPGDTLIVRLGTGATVEVAQELKGTLNDRLPGVDVLVVAGVEQILAYRSGSG